MTHQGSEHSTSFFKRSRRAAACLSLALAAGSCQALAAPYSGSWSTFRWVGKVGEALKASLAPVTGTPYSGTPVVLPMAFPAVNFDKGGQGVAYRDLSAGNAGRVYRTSEDVDIAASTDDHFGGYKVNDFQAGEWLSYTVKVPADGNYDLSVRAANDQSTPAAFHIEVDGVNVTGTVTVARTGSWNTFQWFGKQAVPLKAGKRVLKVVSEQQYFDVSAVSLLAAPAPAPSEFGVYRWEAPKAPANVDAFEAWLGRPVPLAQAFEARDIWDNIDGAAWQLGPWSQWVRAKPGRNLVLGVPMMPGEPDGSGPDRIRGTADDVSLEQCAAGQYDGYWRNLANELAFYGLHWAYLRLGWEMDGSWYAWGAPQGSGKQAHFAGCFRRMVQVMRATQPANQWKFVWNPTATWTDPAYLNATWPGDAYVDVVGIDLYDHSWTPNTYPYPPGCDSACRLARQQAAWNGPGGYGWYLQTVRNFAAARGKPFAIPEWGLETRTDGHGGGDNSYYIQKMHEFISNPANGVLFHVYFDVNSPDGDHHVSGLDAPTTFPQSAIVFRQLFGAPAPGATPAPSTTVPASTASEAR